jgi:hypothetical protein
MKNTSLRPAPDPTAENEMLRQVAMDLHWMARRYADGRQTYATSLFNDHTRALLKAGVKLNPTGDGTLWARDGAGRSCDHLSDEEAAMGGECDWKHPNTQRRLEETAKALQAANEEIARLRAIVEKSGLVPSVGD